MAFALRPYQETMIGQTRVALRTHRSVLLQSPTGSGKTALSAYMLGSAAAKAVRSFFVVHRQELIEQSALTFDKVGIEFGVIAAGFSPRPWAPVQIASIDTLKRRLGRVPLPGLIVWDETHHIAAAGWAAVFKHFAQAKHVGLSATPCRLDGKGLNDFYSTMVRGPSVAWLIEHGFLAPFKVYAPQSASLDGVRTKMGDYVKADIAGLMDSGTITGDAIRQYRQHAEGKLAIAFCCSIAHSQHVAEQYRAAGIPAAHLDGETDRGERSRIMQAFRRGELRVLTNVDLFGEGVDVPGVEVVQMLRPTQSLSLYLQQAGRACRIAPGKTHALILDHAGNVMRHGLPDDDREWTLEGEDRKRKAGGGEKGDSVRMCPKCFGAHRPAPKCPHCGHQYVIEGRKPEVKDGELVEVDVQALRRQRVVETRQARTEAELITLGMMRGYRDPEGWARHMMKVRADYREKFQGQGGYR